MQEHEGLALLLHPACGERARLEIRARSERPLAGPRNGECPLYLACYRPSGMRAPDCLDSPVYEPNEEHATAPVPNAKERMDPACRMQIVYAVVVKSVRCWCSEYAMAEVRRVEEKA
jgi:hypothetical protein